MNRQKICKMALPLIVEKKAIFLEKNKLSVEEFLVKMDTWLKLRGLKKPPRAVQTTIT